MNRAYCLECGWEKRREDDQTDLSLAMIEHYCETGHVPIEREGVVDREEKPGRTRDRSIVGLLENE